MTFTVTCPSCSSMFPVDPAKIPPNGVRAQCSICPEIFDVEEPILAKEMQGIPPGTGMAPGVEAGVVEVVPPADESGLSPESVRRSAEDKEKSLVRSLASDVIGHNSEEHSEIATFKEVFDEDVARSLKDYQEQVESEVAAQGKPPSSSTS